MLGIFVLFLMRENVFQERMIKFLIFDYEHVEKEMSSKSYHAFTKVLYKIFFSCRIKVDSVIYVFNYLKGYPYGKNLGWRRVRVVQL